MNLGDQLMLPLVVGERIGPLLGQPKAIGWGLVFPLFVLALLIQKYRLIIGKEPDYGAVIGRLVLVVLLLLSYGQIYGLITGTAASISKQISGGTTLSDYERQVQGGLDKDFSDWNNDHPECQGVEGYIPRNWTKCAQLIFPRAVLISLYAVMYTVYRLFAWLATLLLSLLLLLAPIMIALSTIPGLDLFKNWIRYVAEISCWHVLMNALIRLQGTAGFGLLHTSDTATFFERMAACALFTAAIIITPWLTSSFVKDAGIGAAGSMALAHASELIRKVQGWAGGAYGQWQERNSTSSQIARYGSPESQLTRHGDA